MVNKESTSSFDQRMAIIYQLGVFNIILGGGFCSKVNEKLIESKYHPSRKHNFKEIYEMTVVFSGTSILFCNVL